MRAAADHPGHAVLVAVGDAREPAVEGLRRSARAAGARASGSARTAPGVSVSATMPEITTAIEIVTANWR